MTPTPDVQAVLDEAAEIIEQRGWTQGEMGDPWIGPRCMLGAIYSATPGDEQLRSECTRAIAERISPAGGDAETQISIWNDRHGRTKTQVLARLRGAR
jgi:hypothetical protein